MTTPKRIMRDFRISELSAVDRPAQTHAKMTIMKRDGDDDDPDKEQTMLQKTEPRGFDTLDDAIEHLQNVHKCGKREAMQEASRRWPSLVEKFNDEGVAIAERAAEEVRKARARPEAEAEFNMRVAEIAARDNIPRHVAMRRARKEHPNAFARLQGAR